MSEEPSRRLTTIAALDVAGYSRLMREDEEATLAALRAARREVVEPALETHGGRVANTAGDSPLLEFASTLSALRCCRAIQQAMAAQALRFRIGLHVGDVFGAGTDLLGDGVNIAARIEGIAEPGGICLSGTAHDLLRQHSDLAFDDLGPQRLKNIDEPVRIFRLRQDGGGEARPRTPVANRRTVMVAGLALLLAAIVAAGGTWLWRGGTGEDLRGATAGMTVAITVRPFRNLSDDPEQAYFATGITEDIATDLSKIEGLTVRTGPSAQDRSAQDRSVPGRAGGYRLTGSVRRAAGRLRVSAALQQIADGRQVWAERYDRELADIFAIQDEIAGHVVAALSQHLAPDAARRIARAHTPDIRAYDLYIRGRARRIPPTPDNLRAAERDFEEAVAIDPRFAGGYAGGAYVAILRFTHLPPGGAGDGLLARAEQLADRAVALDPAFGPVWGALAVTRYHRGAHEDALTAIRRAMREAPGDSLMRAEYGRLLGYAGRPEEGIAQVNQARRMSPDSLPLLFFLGGNQRAAGQFEAAIDTLREHRRRLAGRLLPAPNLQLAAALAQAGRSDEARAVIRDVRRALPAISLALAERMHVYGRESDRSAFRTTLRQAGLR